MHVCACTESCVYANTPVDMLDRVCALFYSVESMRRLLIFCCILLGRDSTAAVLVMGWGMEWLTLLPQLCVDLFGLALPWFL